MMTTAVMRGRRTAFFFGDAEIAVEKKSFLPQPKIQNLYPVWQASHVPTVYYVLCVVEVYKGWNKNDMKITVDKTRCYRHLSVD